MSPTQPSAGDRKKAETLYQEAVEAYNRWDVAAALQLLEDALKLAPNNPAYHMYMAQTLCRTGDFDRALRALANYLRLAPDSPIAGRVEQLFASGMDPVEDSVTSKMTEARIAIEMIGAAIQMWMEFRIALGEEILAIPKPEAWAAALDYTVRKVNLREASLEKLAAFYGVVSDTVRKHSATLVKKLDVMPCDYRYFIGDENPLDKLVEAAELLDKLETRFSQES